MSAFSTSKSRGDIGANLEVVKNLNWSLSPHYRHFSSALVLSVNPLAMFIDPIDALS